MKNSWKRSDIMIFSETVGKKTQFTSPVYVYKAHFLLKVISVSLCLNYPALFSLNLWKKIVKTLGYHDLQRDSEQKDAVHQARLHL